MVMRRRALTGCLVGGLLVFVILILVSELDPYREQGVMSIPEFDAARDVSLTMILYTNGSDDRFPPQLSALTTPALLRPYLAHMPLHEFERSDGRELVMSEAGYTWNQELAGISEDKIGSPSSTCPRQLAAKQIRMVRDCLRGWQSQEVSRGGRPTDPKGKSRPVEVGASASSCRFYRLRPGRRTYRVGRGRKASPLRGGRKRPRTFDANGFYPGLASFGPSGARREIPFEELAA
jgi:hypothetical protein